MTLTIERDIQIEARAMREAADSMWKASHHKSGLATAPGDRDNWVERDGAGGRGGQLPAYVTHVALALVRKRGMPRSKAIGMAIGIIRRWARGGGNVDEGTRAASLKAMAEWSAMKARAAGKRLARAVGRVTEAEVLYGESLLFSGALIREAAKAPAEESNLVRHARTELERAGLLDADSDYDGMLGRSVLKMVKSMSGEGHSGMSAAMAIDAFQRLASFKPLTPLTSDPDEWNHIAKEISPSRDLWQSSRDAEAMSHDGGKTYYLVSELNQRTGQPKKHYTSAKPGSRTREAFLTEREALDAARRAAEPAPGAGLGTMIALYPTPSDQKALAIVGGEPADDLHVTLAYLGKDLTAQQLDRVMEVVQRAAADVREPVSATVGGHGTFTEGPEPVRYAAIDAPAIDRIRERISSSLRNRDLPVADDHGFTPHLTVGYGLRHEGAAVPTGRKLAFNALTLKHGDRRWDVPLTPRGTSTRLTEAERAAEAKAKGGQLFGMGNAVYDVARMQQEAKDRPEVTVDPRMFAHAFGEQRIDHTYAMKADLTRPVLLAARPNGGIALVDGWHRAWAANAKGRKLTGQVLSGDQLEQCRITQASQVMREAGVSTEVLDPELWRRAKQAAKKRMGGQWSAQAAQQAVKIYKQRGGTYRGRKPPRRDSARRREASILDAPALRDGPRTPQAIAARKRAAANEAESRRILALPDAERALHYARQELAKIEEVVDARGYGRHMTDESDGDPVPLAARVLGAIKQEPGWGPTEPLNEAGGQHRLDFYEHRSTPVVTRIGQQPKPPKANYGRHTSTRRSTPDEDRKLARGDWLRVDSRGRTPTDAAYRGHGPHRLGPPAKR